MSVVAGAVAPASPVASVVFPRRRVDAAITRRAFHQLWIGATVCAAGFGLTVLSTALSYVSTFPTEAARQQLESVTSADSGLAVLLGPITGVGTVGGYTVYKIFVFLTTVGAVWALLAATRLLRGEEDAGRWQLVLAGGTRPVRATLASLAALGGAVTLIFAGTLAGTLLAGRDARVGFGVGESVLYALSLAVAPAVFAVVGAVTSQLGRTRRVASGLGMAVFAFAYVVRMIGDAGAASRWMLWLTPFGWTERMQPFTENDPWPLVPAAVTVVVLGGLAAWLSARRDVGDGILASRDVTPVRPRGLGSTAGLALRLERGVLAAWCGGAVAAALVLGIIAKLTVSSIPASMTDTLDKFGVQGAFLDQYLGVAFLMVATVVALLPAGQIGAAADEELSGRLVHVLAQPVARARWLAERLVITAAAVVAAAVLSGGGAWLGARSQGVEVGLVSMLGAGVNVVPSALVALGLGAVLLSVVPRAASATIYAVVVWSVMADIVGALVSGLGWTRRLSLFHFMALAPAQPIVWSTVLLTLAVALGLCVLAVAAFARRDVRRA